MLTPAFGGAPHQPLLGYATLSIITPAVRLKILKSAVQTECICGPDVASCVTSSGQGGFV